MLLAARSSEVAHVVAATGCGPSCTISTWLRVYRLLPAEASKVVCMMGPCCLCAGQGFAASQLPLSAVADGSDAGH